ncbi:MAG: hypothetical protein K5697_15985 [Lachnospiraceae bacterium]|nr:hypothetical protein [Lachnospiraceae bacterium]
MYGRLTKGKKMIVFEEELKKFHKSLEVDDVQETLNKEDLSDMMDILLNMSENYDQATVINNQQG